MATKRRNTIAGSLNKKGKELDVDKLKEQVKNLHSPEKKSPKKSNPKPVKPTKVEERIVRLSIDAPENVYWEMKKRVLHERMTLKKYVLKLIKKDLGID